MKFKSKFFLAPMAEVNEIAFRKLCSNYGAGLTYTEMISCTALARGNKKSFELFNVHKSEKPIAVQLMGENIEDIKRAVKIVQDKADIIDFNMGCPMKRIVDCGCGAALLKKPKKVKEIVEALVSVSKKPVSVKIRSGWDSKSINAVEIAKIIERRGASMITVHAKTKIQLRSGDVDLNVIKEVKDNVSIPVVGNGGISKPEEASKMFSETGCDYIMIGRAASRNPYIFTQLNDYFKTGRYKEGDADKIKKDYLDLAIKYNSKFKYIRDHFMYMSKGLSGGPKLREKLSKTKNIEEIKKIMG